ncbi:MAG: glycosyl hydrolase family 2 [Tannerella sp.]|jgi:hypothetical protein|nr:glycosyl hydrolase family 2 [Tannerella sp.]
MKKPLLSLAVLLLSAVCSDAQEWPAAQPGARPATRWWWPGSAVDRANLTWNLESYAEAGIGSVEITPIYGVQGNEAAELTYLSPEWMQMLQHTLEEGKRLHIETDMNTGTGWPFGGPDVSVEDAATKAVFREYELSGGSRLPGRIEPEDEKQRPVAKLSRLMAYSGGESDTLPVSGAALPRSGERHSHGKGSDTPTVRGTTLPRQGEQHSHGRGQALDLTDRVKDGCLQWTAPEGGTWRIIALFEGKTFQTVKRAAPGGEGYVIDHFSAKAVNRYLSRFDKAFEMNRTSRPHAFFNDSYEVYGADWTPGLPDEFARRRGYRLEDHFPAFLDTTRIDGRRPETTARILSDYRETLSELLNENFTRQWTAWAHRHGSVTRNQAHGSPGNLIDLYASVDIPECEGFGLSEFHIEGLRRDSLTRPNDADLSMLKYASSAAHIAGKPCTSSETLTWLTEHFRTSLSQCKPEVDLLFVSGVNRVSFHGTPYSPRRAEWPGWLFYATVNLSPANTVWRDAPAFFEYITRCQSFLQKGKPDNDFLLYLPLYDLWHEQPGRLPAFDIHRMKERAPGFIATVNGIMRCGYDVDYISDAFVRSTQCRGDGRLVTPGGISYKALIVPAVHLMPGEVLEHLLKLAREGADIVFMENFPRDVPGYGNLEKRRRAFRKIAGQLPGLPFDKTGVTEMQKGRIITGSDYATTLAQCRATAEEMKTKFGLQFIRRSDHDGHHYFISSLQDKSVDSWITLGVEAAAAALYDPLTGKSGMAQTRLIDGKTQVYLQLRSGESLIVKTFKDRHNAPGLSEWNYYTDRPVSLSLDHGWSLRFIESEPSIKETFPVDRPVPWTAIDHPDTKRNSGTALYSLTFTLPALQADEWVLDLGDVRESARVIINGRYAGTCWAVPFRIKAGDYLNGGVNRIELEVTNLPANRIADYERRGINWRIFKDINLVDINYKKTGYGHWEPLPSGLNSPVKLIPVNRTKPLN